MKPKPQYDGALKSDEGEARAHHGRARMLTARNRLDEALVEAQEAVRLAPREPEFHHTVGVIYERQHRYEEAAAAYGNYVNLLPNKYRSDKAAWTRAEIRFLDSFRGRTAVEFEGDRSVLDRPDSDRERQGARAREGQRQGASDFVLDTGAEQTVVSRDLARRRGIMPITYMQSAGVGDVGLRGLQVGRIDSLEVGDLKVRNVPCLIKNPPLGELPVARAGELLAAGARPLDARRLRTPSARDRHARCPRPATPPSCRCGSTAWPRSAASSTAQPASFVVDTGGEVISISQSTAGQLTMPNTQRRIPLKVYGTSGWDKDAFLLPNVDLEFNSIRFSKIPVVVLNLNAPSALLGFQLGGIVGHKFLSHYTRDDRSRTECGGIGDELKRGGPKGASEDAPYTRSSSSRRAFSRSARRTSAAAARWRSSSVSQNQSRNRHAAAFAIDRDERQVGAARHPPDPGQRFLGEDFDLHFERRAPHRGDARVEDDQVADLDRMQELQAVDRGRHEQACGCADDRRLRRRCR